MRRPLEEILIYRKWALDYGEDRGLKEQAEDMAQEVVLVILEKNVLPKFSNVYWNLRRQSIWGFRSKSKKSDGGTVHTELTEKIAASVPGHEPDTLAHWSELADSAQLYGPERAFLLLEKQYGFGHADVAHLFGLTRQCVGQLFDGIEHRLSVMSGSVRAPKKKRKKRVLADYWKWVESGGNGNE